ncbi:MAG: hypothetical protein KJN95_08450, partial [Gammaproteobacteria bacterium]|nr:hypothetical protein [Gammaproteobacteria bacterium]
SPNESDIGDLASRFFKIAPQGSSRLLLRDWMESIILLMILALLLKGQVNRLIHQAQRSVLAFLRGLRRPRTRSAIGRRLPHAKVF